MTQWDQSIADLERLINQVAQDPSAALDQFRNEQFGNPQLSAMQTPESFEQIKQRTNFGELSMEQQQQVYDQFVQQNLPKFLPPSASGEQREEVTAQFIEANPRPEALGVLETIRQGFMRGFERPDVGRGAALGSTPEELAEQLADVGANSGQNADQRDSQRELGEAVQAFDEADGFVDASAAALDIVGALVTNPRNTAGIIAESLGSSTPALLGAGGGLAVGGPIGLIVGLVAGNAAANVQTEIGQRIEQRVLEAGVDLEDQVAVAALLRRNPQWIQDDVSTGTKKGLTTAAVESAVDVATFGAGKLLKPVTSLAQSGRRAAGALGAQSGGEAGGSAAGSAAVGEDISGGEVLVEGILGAVTGIPDAALALGGGSSLRDAQRNATGGQSSIEVVPPDAEPPAPVLALPAPDAEPAVATPDFVIDSEGNVSQFDPEASATPRADQSGLRVISGSIDDFLEAIGEPRTDNAGNREGTGNADESVPGDEPQAATGDAPDDRATDAEAAGDAELSEQEIAAIGSLADRVRAAATGGVPDDGSGTDQQAADGSQAAGTGGAPGNQADSGTGSGQSATGTGDQADRGVARPELILQNRDRSSASSVTQMSEIAGNPDYLRLSPGRQLAEGTPVVIREALLGDAQLGTVDQAVDAQGESVRVQYAVVEARALLASNQADGTSNPEFVNGAAGRLRTVAGNGRVAGLQAAFERGNATAYTEALAADTAAHGVPAESIAQMEQPVLVRLMDPVDVTADIGDRTNTAGVSALTPVEQAANDAKRVDIGKLEFNADGTPTAESVRRFVQGMPKAEQSGLLDGGNEPSRQANERLTNAVFQAAYEDPELVNLAAAAQDPEARTVVNALGAIASDAVRLKDAGDLDLRPNLVEAAKLAVNARRQGRPLIEFVDQVDLTVSPETQEVARIIATNSRSAKAMTGQLRHLVGLAANQAEKGGVDMFGDIEQPSIMDLIGLATKPEAALFSKTEAAGDGMTGAAVAKVIKELTAKWQNMPDAVILPTLDHSRTPEGVKEQALRSGANDADGFFLDGEIYLIADQLSNAQDVRRVVLHEVLGHYSMKRVFGPRFQTVLRQLQRDRKSEVDQATRNEGLDPGNQAHRDIGAQEYLAYLAQTVPSDKFVGRAVSAIRNFLRRIGFDVEYTNGDVINSILAPARRNIVEGGGDAQGAFDSWIARNPVFSRASNDALIDVDGVQRSTVNSDGEAIHSTEEGARNFWRWFGDSKAVDDSGRPIVVYHGTSRRFSKVNPKKGAQGVFWFTSDKESIQDGTAGAASTKTIMNLYAKIENPAGWDQYDKLGLFEFSRENLDGAILTHGGSYFDGFVFSGDQIKSADLNNGDFSPDNPNILFSRRASDLDAVKSQWQSLGIDSAISEKDNIITVSKIVVPEANRNGGLGSQAMQTLLDYADQSQKTVALSPSTDFGGSRAGLDRFYKSLGFIKNTGRNRDFEISESLYRIPAEFNLESQTPEQLRQQQETQRRERADQARRDAAPDPDDFVLTGSDSEADQAAARGQDSLFSRRAPGSRRDDDPRRTDNFLSNQELLKFAEDLRLPPRTLGDVAVDYRDPFTAAKLLAAQVGDTLAKTFADQLKPVENWVKALDVTESVRIAIVGGLRRAHGQRGALEREVETQFGRPMRKEIIKIAKAHKIGTDQAMQAVGRWMTANYVPLQNQWLSDKDQVAVGEALVELQQAQAALNNAQRQPSLIPANVQALEAEVDTLSAKYDAARAKAAMRQAEINDTNLNRSEFEVGVAGGLTNAQAAKVKTDIEAAIPEAEIRAAAQFGWDAMKWKTQQDLKSGKLTQEVLDGWPDHDEYVPTTGDPRELDYEDLFTSTGSGGSNPNTPRDKEVGGRTSSVSQDGVSALFDAIGRSTNFAAYQDFKRGLNAAWEERIFENTQAGMDAREAAKAAQDDLGMQRLNGEPNVGSSQDEIIYRDGDKTYRFNIGDPSINEAIRRENLDATPTIISRLFQTPTRIYARLVTTFNPGFAPINSMRDIWERSEIIRTRKIRNANGDLINTNQVARSAILHMYDPRNVRASMRRAFDREPNSQAQYDLEEFIELGGLSTWGTYLQKSRQSIQDQLRSEGGYIRQSFPGKSAEGMYKLLEGYNATFDMLSSLSIYQGLLEQGVDKKVAATEALDLMDFRKTGSIMMPIKAMFVFAQPIVTGGYNLIRQLDTQVGRRRFLAYSMLSFFLYSMLKLLDEDNDDEGGSRIDQLGSWTTERSIPIPISDDTVVKIPIGFGLPQLAWGAALHLTRLMSGESTPVETSAELLKTVGKTISPLQPSEISIADYPVVYALQTVSPTLLKPFVNLGVDRNVFGQRITPVFPQRSKLKAEQPKFSTPPEYVDAAVWMQRNMGFDVYPEQIRTVATGLLVGPFRELFFKPFIDNPNRERLDRDKVPIYVSQFVSPFNQWAKIIRAREAYDGLQELAAEEKSRRDRNEVMTDWLTPERRKKLVLYKQWKRFDQDIRNEKARATRAFTKGKITKAVKEARHDVAQEKRNKGSDRFLLRYRRMIGKPTTPSRRLSG